MRGAKLRGAVQAQMLIIIIIAYYSLWLPRVSLSPGPPVADAASRRAGSLAQRPVSEMTSFRVQRGPSDVARWRLEICRR